MYLDFFKFKKNPFHITPDPDFLFLSPSHKEASASIFYGIEKRKGFVAVTGEVGVGKTTILRTYLEGTDPKRIRVVYVFNAALSFDKLLKQIVSELGIKAAGEDSSELVDSLFHFLIDEYEADRNVVLIIDEAQNMPVETLERLRMLSNLETSQDKLLQIILVGQPEFEDKLNLPELRQLKQRIAIRCRIEALTPEESLAYIHHRLMKASQFHNPVFTKEALKRIAKEADGIPRIINVLCDNALVTAFGYQRKPVDDKIVKEVLRDFQGVRPKASFIRKIIWVPALVACLALLFFVSRSFLPLRGITSVNKQTLRAKVPEPPPAAKEVGQPGVVRPLESVARSKPSPAAPEVKPSAKSVSRAKSLSGAKSGPVVAEVKPSAGTVHKSKSVRFSPEVNPPAKSVSGAKSGPVVAEVKTPAGTVHKSKSVRFSPEVNPPVKSVSRAKSGPVVAEVKPPVVSSPKAESAPAVPTAPATGGDESVSKGAPENTLAPAEPSRWPHAALPSRSRPAEKALSALVVKKGDCVSQLLMDTYGRVDDNMLRSFRDLNPNVKNINRIMVGEKLVLPKVQPADP